MDNRQSPYHDVFFAHQPVFYEDRNGKTKVWGYELYYRGDALDEAATFPDEVMASMEVMANLALSPDAKFRSAPVIINFSDQAVLEEVPCFLPPKTTVVQISDPEDASPQLLAALESLKTQGYSLSIDDYQARPENRGLYEIIDILTLSLSGPLGRGIQELLTILPMEQKHLLAKQVEDRLQFEQARDFGFTLFQGHFFKKPETKTLRKISSIESLRLKVLKQLSQDDMDIETLSESIKQDPSLSMRLLNLLNSPAYGLTSEIVSIKQAVVYLGWNQLKQWLRVILLTDLKQPKKTVELMRLSLMRARFLENLPSSQDQTDKKDSLFMLGLFSLLDVMLELPTENILEYLSKLDEDITACLAGNNTPLTPWLNLVLSLEESNWQKVGACAAFLNLEPKQIMKSYKDALEWSNQVLFNV